MFGRIYYEYTSETYTKKSVAPKETMGGIHKMLSKNKTQQFSSLITTATRTTGGLSISVSRNEKVITGSYTLLY